MAGRAAGEKRCSCGKRAVYFRKYEGTYLCREHFLSSVERKVKKNIRTNSLIESCDRIAVAVSGGKDSMVLLSIMDSIVSPRKDMRMVVISVDEGIKGYRDKGIRAVRDFCRKHKIKHHKVTFRKELGKTTDQVVREIRSGKEKRFGNPCTFCGVARRYVLNKTARKLKCSKLCLGHNLDDEVQSILMNYMRGDLARASRMGPKPVAYDRKFVARIKPLRTIPEKELALYAVLRGLDFHNRECPNRSGMRNEVREFLQSMEREHSGMKFTILESFDRMLPYIRDMASREDKKVWYCTKCGEPASGRVCSTCQLWKSASP
jgi:uncharacterized protein (TIGR00269 family)